MSRLERLINLMGALVATDRPLTAAELRERVPGYPDEKASFRRQFERDKDALRELGLPIQLHDLPGPDGEVSPGYRIPKDQYAQRDPGLTDEERAALQVAARVVRMRGVDAPDAWWKLGVRPADEIPDASRPEGPRPSDVDRAISGTLAEVFEAIVSRRELRFSYRDLDRVVIPGQLRFGNGHWYLAGFDQTRGEERSFRVDRIAGRVTLGDELRNTGDRGANADGRDRRDREDTAPEPWELGSGPAEVTRLLVDPDQAPWAIRHLGDRRIVERRRDGSVVFELSVANAEAFRSFVLGFLDHAEVLSPPSVRAAIRDWALAASEGRT